MTQKIINGEAVEEGTYTFPVALYNSNEEFFCGGSLITPNVVLTAAHCSENAPDTVRLGCVNRTDKSSCEIIKIAESFIHPLYDEEPYALYNDIMLLLLEEDSVQEPVTLLGYPSGIFPNDMLSVVGWGNTHPETYSVSDILLETELKVVYNEPCDIVYRSAYQTIFDMKPYETVVDKTMFCTAGEGTDTCQGDSGSPVFYKCEKSGKHVQVGVVSFGLGCAYEGIPGLNARVYNRDTFSFIFNTLWTLRQNFVYLNDLSQLCEHEGTLRPTAQIVTPPTMYPTFGDKWICDPTWFAATDGCDCECGMQDPDCEYSSTVYGCGANALGCVDGKCNYSEEDLLLMTPTVSIKHKTSQPTIQPTLSLFEDTVSPTNSPTEQIDNEAAENEVFSRSTDPSGVIIVAGLLLTLALLTMLILVIQRFRR